MGLTDINKDCTWCTKKSCTVNRSRDIWGNYVVCGREGAIFDSFPKSIPEILGDKGDQIQLFINTQKTHVAPSIPASGLVFRAMSTFSPDRRRDADTVECESMAEAQEDDITGEAGGRVADGAHFFPGDASGTRRRCGVFLSSMSPQLVLHVA
ncbi:hypothetical protein SKAU_G00073560 [Synaphobranchus kaupii]|uniref:Uncharacterized protein n=1 Tax=Synaphobranchus kaupii TaxID=118154 RepID=A0A9Q1G875_SYNKA|nr:hypothetical protein SKAU_G00073560 [Synaphobranchus kaupii]